MNFILQIISNHGQGWGRGKNSENFVDIINGSHLKDKIIPRQDPKLTGQCGEGDFERVITDYRVRLGRANHD